MEAQCASLSDVPRWSPKAAVPSKDFILSNLLLVRLSLASGNNSPHPLTTMVPPPPHSTWSTTTKRNKMGDYAVVNDNGTAPRHDNDATTDHHKVRNRKRIALRTLLCCSCIPMPRPCLPSSTGTTMWELAFNNLKTLLMTFFFPPVYCRTTS